MTPGLETDRTWIWHPAFSEEQPVTQPATAGRIVHFRKKLIIPHSPTLRSLRIHITADTRYRLYVNGQAVAFGPVKGDRHAWFYDDLEIAPFLRPGDNTLAVVVLRYFYATQYATSFPRLPTGGLRVVAAEKRDEALLMGPWECAIDTRRILRVDEPEDCYLHHYEDTRATAEPLEWMSAEPLEFRISTGNSAPWNLKVRPIPFMTGQPVRCRSVHNVHSTLSVSAWQAFLDSDQTIQLPAGSGTHRVDIEAPEHMTAFIRLVFARPATAGGKLTIQYSESYESEPRMVPFLRTKAHRQDHTRTLYGPKDVYEFGGPISPSDATYPDEAADTETVAPFHWRTFRFLQLTIVPGHADLVLRRMEITTANYPLDVRARLELGRFEQDLWDVSIRTLRNCMHDTYEDCPMYEQLQYAMDTRSSILFTYCSAGDDRMARHAITQLHSSFSPSLGLTYSRAPSRNAQVIPPFSLYWILALADHLAYFGNPFFIKKLMPAVDAILGYFEDLIDSETGLVVSERRPGIWNFEDWVEEWRPYGIPPEAAESNVSCYVNALYAYTLRAAAGLKAELRRPHDAKHCLASADSIAAALTMHCFDGTFFTDSLARLSSPGPRSQHAQIWAVLCGATSSPEQSQALLRRSLAAGSGLLPTSLAMSFYTLRALSAAGGTVYDEHFHEFWAPWRAQLQLGLTTWEEDSVSQRSDCHAWGSAPIYEFVAEVAGVRPAQAGWREVAFAPRIGLYEEFAATVPMGSLVLAHVRWAPGPEPATVKVSLRCEMAGRMDSILVKIDLRGVESCQSLDDGEELTMIVGKGEMTSSVSSDSGIEIDT